MVRFYDSNLSKLFLVSGLIIKYDIKGFMEKNFIEDNINSMVEIFLFFFRFGSSSFDVVGVFGLLFGMVFEIYIVGRRFCDEVEVIFGVSIFFFRDFVNVKDFNVIKVFFIVFVLICFFFSVRV